MEWVETTGKTVEEAVDAALDQLGVDIADAEYEVLEEPKTGLFGRLRTEARVRARVRPTTPRPKEERRGRGRKPAGGRSRADGAVAPTRQNEAAPPDSNQPKAAPSAATKPAARQKGPPRSKSRSPEREPNVSNVESASIEEQGELAADFVRGVIERFGASTATVAVHPVDEETVEVRVEGKDLGLLIGPTGAALQSLQELTRASVQQATGARSGRILVDISGYRQRRKESLERFARQVADDVLAGGVEIALNPMNPADRKVIHDTINDIDGVATLSQGEEPHRRVVVTPV